MAWKDIDEQARLRAEARQGDRGERPRTVGRRYHVGVHSGGWQLWLEDSDDPPEVYTTRGAALRRACELAERYDATLSVHRDTGEVHETFNYTSGARGGY